MLTENWEPESDDADIGLEIVVGICLGISHLQDDDDGYDNNL